MTLPATGEISFDAIRIELNIPSQTPFSIETAENGGYVTINKCASPFPVADNPAQISEWRGYNHAATLATLLSANGQDYSATSCTAACNAAVVCDTELYTKSSTVYTNASCSAAPAIGYYAVCSGGSHSDCYDVGSNGTINSITACGSTTTTTTTTTTVAGTCYKITYTITPPGTSPTIQWQSVNGTVYTGTLTDNTPRYICSIIPPTESPALGEVTIDVCSPADPCTNNCTSLNCKSCGYTC